MQIIIADSRKLVCDSVQLVASTVDGISIAGQATDFDAAQKLIESANGPATLITGVRFGDHNVLDLMAFAAKSAAQVQIILMIHPHETNYAREALKSGVMAVFMLEDMLEHLPRILAHGMSGIVTMPSAVLSKILTDSTDPLTKREHEIMALLAEGLTNFQISARLGLSQNTVKYYLKAIYQKLDVGSRGAAIAKYVAGDF